MDLVEAYYAVAESLRQQGERMLETADSLARAADAMCEARIREKSAKASSSPETQSGDSDA